MKIKVKDGVTPKLKAFNKEYKKNISRFLVDLSFDWKKKTQTKLSKTTTGKFPALRTGRLRSSVLSEGPQIKQQGTTTTAFLDVNTVYATIQEEGGTTGRFNSVVIPPRPYAVPSIKQALRTFAKKLAEFIMGPLK